MLYVVATPIGNLSDITLRAVEVLKSVELILAEDTRHSRHLLNYYRIDRPLQSFHQHSNPAKLAHLVGQLQNGQSMAVITDAGTPGISDPGGQLVAAARLAGVSVTPIPGVSAVTTLLSVSGLPTDHFEFFGFLPTKKGRQTLLKKIVVTDHTSVWFEGPSRIIRLLTELNDLAPALKLVIGRELTKLHEEVLTGTPAELLDYFQARESRGEFVIACVGSKK